VKATLLKIAAAAGGVTLALCIAAACVLWYASRPKPPEPWDTSAIRISAIKAVPLDKLNANLKQTDSGIDFTFDAANTTGLDLTLPKDTTVMQETKSSHALHDSFLKLDRDYFIPAHHAVTISLGNAELCAPNFDPRGCFHAYFEEDQEIVLFDHQNRREIHITMPALTIPEFQAWKPEKAEKKGDHR
jgi:hypothetical protein